jgi:rhodanese-related sulfurtransferase
MKLEPFCDNVFYWVDYKYAASHLYAKVRQVQDSFERLCGFYRGKTLQKKSEYPLVKMTLPTRQGKRNYFGFNLNVVKKLFSPVAFRKLGDTIMQKLLTAPPEIVGSRQLTPEIEDILSTLTKIHWKGKDTPLLFGNKLPSKNGGKYSKGLLAAGNLLKTLYSGTFHHDCRCNPEFMDKNQDLITDETWEKLKEVKGSWEKVEKLVLLAARNYRQWFFPENQPESKDWLTRDIKTWLYDSYNQTSLFLACIVAPPYPIRETYAERIFESLPTAVQDVGLEIYDDHWDTVVYWSKLRDIYHWYKKAKKLGAKEPNLIYWLDGGFRGWFQRYYKWVTELTNGGIYLANIGINCATWYAWCIYAKGKHHIDGKVFSKLNGFDKNR